MLRLKSFGRNANHRSSAILNGLNGFTARALSTSLATRCIAATSTTSTATATAAATKLFSATATSHHPSFITSRHMTTAVAAGSDSVKSVCTKTPLVQKYFGYNVFDRRAMKENLSPDVYNAFVNAVDNGKSVELSIADAIAKALLSWAQARGATHFTHWFQPLSGATAEKHDTFLDINGATGEAITRFRGKDLVMGEPDGSSFPSGGLRITHTARGYTCWDPHSPPFLIEHGNGSTLYIPACFFSWKDNHALDDKVPLLRSLNALRREALRLFEVLGDSGTTTIHTDSGLEQEFFLIDRNYWLKRPDLMVAGRTLVGAAPPKGQELEDQYFAPKAERFVDVIHAFEMEMWKLGVPIMTRHREVAPGQYEVAPRFATSNMATDRNLIMMEMLKRVARRHGLAAILHEKPFKGVNGSGKHNNWSFGTNKVPSLLDPGSNPETNTQFMLFLSATLRAVDQYSDLLRWAIAGAGNDHRLGANEAPPAIISAYLGDDVAEAVERFLKKDRSPSKVNLTVNLNVPTLPPLKRAATDRNRTSPFAFTGNKFEFRAVGAPQTPSRSNMILNTILADSIRYVTNEIAALKSKGSNVSEACDQVARQTIEKHKRIIFNGNGYSQEWRDEAQRRGLLSLRATPDALSQFNADKNVKLFESMGVLTKTEIDARFVVGHIEYCHKIGVEGKTMIDIVMNHIIPAAVEYQKILSKSLEATTKVLGSADTLKNQKHLLQTLSSAINNAIGETENLEQSLEKGEEMSDDSVAASRHHLTSTIPIMMKCRQACDTMETLLPSDRWPLPTYHQMLFHQD